MSETTDPVVEIQHLISSGAYRVRLHAVRHMIEEGFDERQMLEALVGRLSLIEEYPDELSFLVLGFFNFPQRG